MKKLFFILLFSIIAPAAANTPSTICPSGYTTIVKKSIVIQEGACPSGYVSVGITDTCLVATPSGVCFMYAPANTDFNDGTGVYQFSQICPLS